MLQMCYRGFYRELTGELQGCFSGDTGAFQTCSGVLHWCYRVLTLVALGGQIYAKPWGGGHICPTIEND